MEVSSQWSYWYDRGADILYSYHGSELGYTSHHRLGYAFDTAAHGHHLEPPAHAIPVDVTPRLLQNGEGTLTMDQPHQQWTKPKPPQLYPNMPFGEAYYALPAWEKSLLEHLYFNSQEGLPLLLASMSNNQLIICSDGSAVGTKGSFGWIIANRTTHDRLASNNGPAFGQEISSYRAEGYGMLSGMRCLHLIHKLYLSDHSWECHFYCDNKSLVDHVTGQTFGKETYPNTTLESDWDILAEIETTTTSLAEDNCKVHVHWIKGHQDEKEEYDKLSLPAQLNVDADKLADQYLQEHGHHVVFSKAPLLPTSGIQLLLSDKSVNSKYKTALRLARTTDPLVEHLFKRNPHWTDEVFDNIDWISHGRALNRQANHHTTLVKFLHDILPVGRTVNRYDKKYPPECPSCAQVDEETIDHLWQCTAPVGEQWRKATLRKLSSVLQTLQTPAPIMEVFLAGTTALLYQQETVTIPDDEICEHLYEEQKAIGWDNILKGRLSLAWTTVIKHHRGGEDPEAGLKWTTTVADTLLQQWWALWELRNEDRHGRDKATRSQADQRQAIREMQQLYDIKDTISPSLHWIFSQPLEDKLHWPATVMRAWITNFKPLIEGGYTTALETG